MSKLKEFNEFRHKMNEVILNQENLEIKRFFALDDRCYQEGALSKKHKELQGLCASMVLRCDDCIRYHIIEATKEEATLEELLETFSIALIVGGSIVIPHLRRAMEFLEEVRAEKTKHQV